jgi:methylenetetrahydrofolate dehydrogenase (NADP+)/methenyltetrahydrofolate cyclohydrolase
MIVDGKAIAAHIIRSLRHRPRTQGSVAAILVGEDHASEIFIRQKAAVASTLGVPFYVRRLPVRSSQTAVMQLVRQYAGDRKIAGIIVQLPLPPHIKTQAVLDCIPIQKDIDVLSSAAFGKFVMERNALMPPVAGSISHIAAAYRIPLKGAVSVVIGSGKLVGLPAAMWLTKQGATVYLLNEWTKHLHRFTKDADIIVCGAGKPGLIKGSMLKKGAVVFDAGYGMKHGKASGDCDFASVSKKARLITPVPGGIGPITVAMLFKNFYDLNRARNR